MTRPLTHDEAFERLDALAFDIVDDVERSALTAHVAGCDTCRVELTQLRETAASIALVAPMAQEASSGGSRHQPGSN